MKKLLAYLLLLVVLFSFTACSQSASETTLWVVTEETTWDRMNGQAYAVMEAFEESHPGVKVRLDILPTGEQERSAYLQSLRTQIMQGGGPDAYLLPTSNRLIIDDGAGRGYPTVDPLFADVRLAMENGMFRDIAKWYNEDAQLGKDSLNTTIMDAGVIGNSRYVLPLRYDIPVIYAQNQELEKVNFDLSALEKPLPELVQAALNTGNAFVAAGAVYGGSSALSGWIDYTSGQVTLTEETLTAYLENYQKVLAATQGEGKATRIDLRNYIFGAYDQFPGFTLISSDWNGLYAVRYPLYIGSMAHLLDYAPIAQYEESEYTITPLRTDAGDVVASVTYYAAMGSGCRQPELTYEFLRQFLTEDSQWEENRPTKMNMLVGKPPSKSTQDKSKKSQYPGLIEEGWAVRTKGSLNSLWEVPRRQFYSALEQGQYKYRIRKIGLTPLNEQWSAILETPIDQVRFPSAMDTALTTALGTLNQPMTYQPANTSVQELSKALLWDMRRHVSEG